MSVVSEVRAKFTATADGVRETMKGLRDGIKGFGQKTQEELDQANKKFDSFKSSLKTLDAELNKRGNVKGFKDLQEEIKKTQTQMKNTGTVTVQTMATFSRALAGAKYDLSQMSDKGSESFKALERSIQGAEKEMMTLAKAGGIKGLTSEMLKAQDAGKGLMGVLAKEFGNADKIFRNVADSTKKFRQQILSIKGAAVGVTAVTAAMTGLGVFTENYNVALQSLAHQTGATDEQVKAMGQSMQNLYAQNVGQDFQDIATAMAAIENSTGLAGQALEDATKNALNFRDSFGYDVVESSATASQMMTQFGISADEAYTLMTQGAQSGLDKNGDMLDSFNEYSVYFERLGFDAEGMWNVFKAGSESGAFNMDKVGDAVKELGIRVKDGSKTTADGFAALGLNADEMASKFAAGGDSAQTALQTVFRELAEIEDPVKRNAAGVALFGTQFEDLEYKTIAAMGTVRDEADMTGDSLDKIDKSNFQTVGQAIQGIGRTLVVGLINPMNEQVMPVINRMVDGFKQAMPTIQAAIASAFAIISNVFSSLEPTFHNLFNTFMNLAPAILTPLGLAFSALSAILPPILNVLTGVIEKITGFGAFAPILAGIISAFVTYQATLKAVMAAQAAWAIATRAQIILTNLWRAAVMLLNSAWLMNPIGLIIAAVVGLGVALYMAYQRSETFRNGVTAAWNGIKTAAMAVWAWFQTLPAFFSGLWSSIVSGVSSFVSGVVAWFSNMYTSVSSALSSFVSGVRAWFANLGTQIITTLQTAWAAVTGAFTALGGIIMGVLSGLWATITGVFMAGVNAIRNVFSPLASFFSATWTNIQLVVLGIIAVLINALLGNFNGMKQGLVAIWTGLSGQISNIVSTIASIAINAFNLLRSGIITVVNGVQSGVIAAFNAVRSGVTAAVNGIRSGAVAAFNAMRSALISGVNAIRSGVVSGFNALRSSAIGAVNALRSGAVNAFNSLRSAVTSAVNGIKSAVTNGFNSARSAAVSAWNGLVSAVRSGVSSAISTVRGMATSIVGAIRGINLRSIGSDIISGLVNGMSSMLGSVRRKAEEIASTVKGAIANLLKIRSPSRVMIEMGKNVGEGLAIGMDSTRKMVSKASSGVAIQAYKEFEEYVDKMKKANKMTLAQQKQAYLNASRAYRKGGAMHNDAMKEIQRIEAEMRQASYDAGAKMIEDRVKANKMSLIQEAEAWKKLSDSFIRGTKVQVDAQNKMLEIKQKVQDKLTAANEAYLKGAQEVNEKLADSEGKLMDEYAKAYDERRKSLYNFAGIFEAVEKNQRVSGRKLLRNLRDQIYQMRDWEDGIENLASRGFQPTLIKELREMGPKAAAEIKALTNLTDAELAEYNQLWNSKHVEANGIASSELATQRANTQAEIAKLQREAAAELVKLKDTWLAEVRAINQGQIDATKKTIPTYTQMGKDTINGMIAGMKSMSPALTGTATTIANSMISAIKSALKIKSPSRVMKALGINTGEGLEGGLQAMIRPIRYAAQNMAAAVTDNMDLSGALGGTLGADATMKTESILRHFFDLSNVPEHIDEARLVSMMKQALENPSVQRQVDRVNYKNRVNAAKPLGGRIT